jgi:hypothetical protein
LAGLRDLSRIFEKANLYDVRRSISMPIIHDQSQWHREGVITGGKEIRNLSIYGILLHKLVWVVEELNHAVDPLQMKLKRD